MQIHDLAEHVPARSEIGIAEHQIVLRSFAKQTFIVAEAAVEGTRHDDLLRAAPKA